MREFALAGGRRGWGYWGKRKDARLLPNGARLAWLTWQEPSSQNSLSDAGIEPYFSDFILTAPIKLPWQE